MGTCCPRSGSSNASPYLADEDAAVLCELCQSEDAHNFHHFIPKTLHSNKWFKKRYTREQMRVGIEVCKSCHTAIHDLIPDEKELGRHYNTQERLF